MYQRILVALDHSPADRAILTHVRALATLTGARLLLVHVADGWAARHYHDLHLRESEEMREDRQYLDRLVGELQQAGFEAGSVLAMGDPAAELVRVADDEQVDLIAMATHGHRGLADLLHGTTVNGVRHAVGIPVLLVRAPDR